MTLAVLLLVSCKDQKVTSELVGSRSRPWFEPVPHGMAFVKQGSFRMGTSDEQPDRGINISKSVSIASFWIDETEITNHQYQQFVKWATDSVLAQLAIRNGVTYYQLTDKDRQPIEPTKIDWEKAENIWTDTNDLVNQLKDSLRYQGKDMLMNRKEINYHKIIYEYYEINLHEAARRSSQFNYKTQKYEGETTDFQTGALKAIESRADFFYTKRVPVYPDTLCWIRDFTYSYNEPWTLKYFRHPAFAEYPVVGVTWEQAKAFCDWRTNRKAEFLSLDLINIDPIHPYRLPTEAEWEYAARGGLQNPMYPWGGNYASTNKGCYMANFKPKRGNYVADSRNSARTVKVATYPPNGYGLYDMAGNVAEWTSTAYTEMSYAMINEINPEIQYNAKDGEAPAMKRKVIRGGSWKDVAYYLQVSTRAYEYQDTATSYVGFRCVMTALESKKQ
jgi:formylglycine-generating enzyme